MANAITARYIHEMSINIEDIEDVKAAIEKSDAANTEDIEFDPDYSDEF